MKSLGASAMLFQSQFSDLISRFGATPEVVGAITTAIEAMSAAGIAGTQDLIDWLKTMGVKVEPIEMKDSV